MATKEKPKLTLAPAPTTNVPPSNRQSSQIASKGYVSLNTKAKSSKLLEEDFSHVDPDELFVKFTISEIKSIQGKLRAEADAKQEELRLMVGERYRDLLQASTSIMYMANSSKQVMNDFAEIRGSITTLEASVSKPHAPTVRGKGDNHLRALQLLSAHIKLLLDAPEHLWRLMENTEYLSATWIYLLSRVVHRVLLTDDPEEAIWQREGINVLTDFPLVQRQWDTIAQMRSQVVHRATLYLRRPITSSEACSAMLSLHLLDSLPLTETLATFLSQRRKTLNTLIAQYLDTASLPHTSSPVISKPNTRHTVEPASSKQTDVIHKFRDTLLEVLEMIWGSLRVAREVFGSTPEGDPSLIQRSLADIYSDTPPKSTLTTVSLLSTLPSSTHLLTLPPSILSYKPYIDLTSPTIQIDPSILNSKLSEWFNRAMNNLESHVRARMTGVRSIRELWSLRRKLLEKLEESKGLSATEKSKLQEVLDAGIRGRIVDVAQKALHDIEDHLNEHVKKARQDVSEGNKNSQMDIYPSNFVFSPPPIPLSHSSAASQSAESPLKPFKAALRRRIERRTPLLDEILNDIETMALDVGADLSVMDRHPDLTPLRAEIVASYEDAAAVSSRRMHQVLDTAMQEVIGKSGDNNALVVFIGRLAYYLSNSSCIKNLRYPSHAAKDLCHNLNKLHEQSLAYWRTRCLSVSIDKYRSMLETSLQGPNKSDFTWPSQPSYQLINTLFYIISSLDKLGLSRQELISNGTIDSVLKDFRSTVATKLKTEGLTWSRETVQLWWDVILLRRLGAAEVADQSSMEDQLVIKLSQLQEGLIVPEDSQSSITTRLEQSVRSYICRAQTLLSPLVRSPPISDVLENGHAEHTAATGLKSSSLLPFGQPEAGHDYRPAIETAKPSARFGLLLVGNTTLR